MQQAHCLVIETKRNLNLHEKLAAACGGKFIFREKSTAFLSKGKLLEMKTFTAFFAQSTREKVIKL